MNVADDTRLILWDIDGTLIRSGTVGGLAFELALQAAVGVRPSSRVVMGGKTDPQIVREYLALMELDDADQHVDGVLVHLEREMASAKAQLVAEGSVLPGIRDLVSRLDVDPRFVQTVLTGNIATNALVKLSAFDLDRYFDLEIGAYGSDHYDRGELVPIARSRARALRALHPVDSAIWVIGDTPHDLAAARIAGVRCILVATGRPTIDELQGIGADAVFDDLSDVELVLELLAS